MTRASTTDRDLLRTCIGHADLDADGVSRAQDAIVRSGALPEVEELIEERYRTGLSALASSGLPEPQQAALAELARAAIERDY